MKFFKQLLVAPAALGLAAPLAASAQEMASLNGMQAVNEYMNQQDVDRFRAWESKNQVTSVNQFSDVRPTDWAYQALSNLVDKYGCVAGYPNGTFKGGNSLSRYEAAALLNSCLERVTEQTDELQRLLTEFQNELTVLRGRVDGLEKKVGKLEAMQFSTTTKLSGEANMVLGGVSYGGNTISPSTNQVRNGTTAATVPLTNALSFNYDVRLNFSTSWSGKDLLYTRLRSGNFGNSAWAGGIVNMTALDKASNGFGGAAAAANQPNVVGIDRLYYRFPVGKELTFTLGPIARNTELVAFMPTAYRAEILDYFTLAGAPGVYNKATGTAFAGVWKQSVPKGKPYFTVSLNYVSADTTNNDNTAGDGNPATGGLFTKASEGNFLAQVGLRGKSWGAAVAYGWEQCGNRARRGTTLGRSVIPCVGQNGGSALSANSVAVGGYWQPETTGWIPSVSLGWGYSAWSNPNPALPYSAANIGTTNNIAGTQSWTIAFQWDNAFAKGNAAGFAFGQPTFVTATRYGSVNDGNYAFEWWYRFQVTDNITVTPAIFYLSNPGGQTTAAGGPIGGGGGQGTLDAFGALVQTTFKF